MSATPNSAARPRSESRYRSPSRASTRGWVWPATTYSGAGSSTRSPGSASIPHSTPLPGPRSPQVSTTRRPDRLGARSGRPPAHAPCGMTTILRPSTWYPASSRWCPVLVIVHDIGEGRRCFQDVPLVRGRGGEHGVQHDDQWDPDPLEHLEYLVAVRTTENAVLVLDHVHVEPVQADRRQRRVTMTFGAHLVHHLSAGLRASPIDHAHPPDLRARPTSQQAVAQRSGEAGEAALCRRIGAQQTETGVPGGTTCVRPGRCASTCGRGTKCPPPVDSRMLRSAKPRHRSRGGAAVDGTGGRAWNPDGRGASGLLLRRRGRRRYGQRVQGRLVRVLGLLRRPLLLQSFAWLLHVALLRRLVGHDGPSSQHQDGALGCWWDPAGTPAEAQPAPRPRADVVRRPRDQSNTDRATACRATVSAAGAAAQAPASGAWCTCAT